MSIIRKAALIVLLLASVASPALGSSGASSHSGSEGGHGAAAAPYDPTKPRTFDVGEFDLRNFRPTHNEIANIRFSLHVVFKPGTSDAVIAELAQWKRRLRDQALTAVRSVDAADLAEPELKRVQRIMLLRLKRLPLPAPVIGVYLTDFAVSSG